MRLARPVAQGRHPHETNAGMTGIWTLIELGKIQRQGIETRRLALRAVIRNSDEAIAFFIVVQARQAADRRARIVMGIRNHLLAKVVERLRTGQ